MKKTTLYAILGFVGLFIIQILRNSPETQTNNTDSPMYGFKADTAAYVFPLRMVSDNGTPVEYPLKAIKEWLYAYKYLWFANQAEYMIKDDDFVDPIIEEVLISDNDGKLPKNSGGVEEIARQVMYRYSTKIKEQQGLERLEKLIQKRYDNPIVSTDRYGDYYTKIVDLGALPTRLQVSVRHGIIRTKNTGVMDDNNRWLSKEIVRQILKYNDGYPNKITFRVWYSTYFGDLEKSFLVTYMAKNPDSPFPPLIHVRPENYYATASAASLTETFYLFHDLEDYANNKYSIYEVDDYKYSQMRSSKGGLNQ
ncbi:hypothetical protein [Emticicia sp. C21]|uniref:hypothetical protein n=1 Tax=Emticicia sp. C21 TaxID=2302915 RepID=UPI000E34BE96|nr:hypothetical protein [Emticicia sp. C21]RFS16346.1 hypothetical protein D0T08_11705 [Emticicia sp. C21]